MPELLHRLHSIVTSQCDQLCGRFSDAADSSRRGISLQTDVYYGVSYDH